MKASCGLFVCLFACCRDIQYLSWESKLVRARRAGWARGWQHLSSQDKFNPKKYFIPELIWLIYLYGWLHIMMNEYPIYFSWKNKLVHAWRVGWAWGWPHLSSQHILSRTDKLFVYFYVCVMMIEDTCWNTEYESILWFICLLVIGTSNTCLDKANLCMPGEWDGHKVDNTINLNFNSNWFFSLFVCCCWNTQ